MRANNGAGCRLGATKRIEKPVFGEVIKEFNLKSVSDFADLSTLERVVLRSKIKLTPYAWSTDSPLRCSESKASWRLPIMVTQ